MVEPQARLDDAVGENAGVTVDCLPHVMEEARRLSVDGLLAFSHGGKEVGGVLYGIRHPGGIRVLLLAELDCEHALGPRFILSENDRVDLGRLMRPPAGLETVGWFRSHTRGGLELDPHDRKMFDRHFPDTAAVGLVLKPTPWGPATATFYLQGRHRDILPDQPHPFDVNPIALAAVKRTVEEERVIEETSEPAASEELAVVRHQPAGSLPAVAPAPVAEISRDPVRISAPRAGRRRAPRWFWPACAGLALSGLVALFYGSRPSPGLGLRAYSTAPGMVRIEWNRRARPVLDGGSGALEIRDGDTISGITLDSGRMQSSSVTYAQRTSHITVQLRVNSNRKGGASVQQTVDFVGAPVPPAPLVAEAHPYKAPPAPAPPPKPLVESPRVKEPPKAVLQARAAPPAASRKTARTLRRTEFGADRSGSSGASQPVLPNAPAIGSGQAHPAAVPEILSGPLIHERAPAPPPTPSPVTRAPSWAGARSGRFIWTGVLGRRGVMEIDGSHVNKGSLTGTFPPVPLLVHVLPAEFSRGGLTVYTPEAAKNGLSEAPSKSNGWNGTRFKFDYYRAHELVILEAPNRTNDYSRLVVRNDGRECSVVVVNWSVLQP